MALPQPFRNRREAGRQLASRLADLHECDELLILAIPRGGVPVAFEVAQELDAPLEVVLVRKLGFPGQEELAMGAIASGGIRVLNSDVLGLHPVPRRVIDAVTARELRELRRQEHAYRSDRPELDPQGHTVIVVDDGLATGSTMLAAVRALRQRQPAAIVVGVPVAEASTCQALAGVVDRVECYRQPAQLFGVGAWYDDFHPTSDDEVRSLLEQASDFGRTCRPG